jgi:hypothetical protein
MPFWTSTGGGVFPFRLARLLSGGIPFALRRCAPSENKTIAPPAASGAAPPAWVLSTSALWFA